MRVGLLTSYEPHEVGIAWVTLPLMKRYCYIRGYSLVVCNGLSSESAFDALAKEFETAMLHLPIWAVIMDPSVTYHDGGPGKRTTVPPKGLVSTVPWCDLNVLRDLASMAI